MNDSPSASTYLAIRVHLYSDLIFLWLNVNLTSADPVYFLVLLWTTMSVFPKSFIYFTFFCQFSKCTSSVHPSIHPSVCRSVCHHFIFLSFYLSFYKFISRSTVVSAILSIYYFSDVFVCQITLYQPSIYICFGLKLLKITVILILHQFCINVWIAILHEVCICLLP